jgi:tRNA-2-methylthio-N6-dimethylallyladenosine synthase
MHVQANQVSLGRAPQEPASQSEAPVESLRRHVYIETMGCQMNVYDSERMLETLAKAGYQATDRVELADLAIVNTCSVRDKVEHKVVSMLGVWRRLKEFNPDLILGVAGCVAQQEGAKLLEKVPYLDLVFGPDQIGALPDLVQARREDSQQQARTDFVHRRDYEFPMPEAPADGRVTAMVTIMKGCNKVCSFCIVPFTRGREVSKPSQQVVDEVRMLVEHGVREVTLLGQNVNSYGKDRVDRDGVAHELDFAELIHKVAEIDGLERIRFTTSHPMDCTDALIDAFATCKKLAPFFHLPIQSGSPKVLQGMRRAHGVDDYLAKIERLRKAVPDIALSTDLIVGFPGETEEDFEMTLALMREVRYATLFSFLYSPRPGTKAAEFKDDVPMAVKKQRLTRLQAIQDEMTDSWMAGYAGKIVDVLVEGPSRLQNAGPNSKLAEVKALGLPQLMGRTPENVIVNFAVETPAELVSRKGTIARVRIDHVRPHSLLGTLV